MSVTIHRPPARPRAPGRRAPLVALLVLTGLLIPLVTTTAGSAVRIRAVALETADPAVGLWQRGATILDISASGEVRYVSDPVTCRVGEVQGKDFTKVADGQYTVSNGNFAADGCTATSFSSGFGLQVAGDVLSAGSSPNSWKRLPATALAATDLIIGQWQNPTGTVVNEVRPDGSVRIVKGPQCRVGQLDSYDLKPSTTAGTYTVRNGVFQYGACTASSFTSGFTLTLGPDGLRPGGGGAAPWTKVTSPTVPPGGVTQPTTPTPSAKDTPSLHVFYYNVGGAWVSVAMLARDKGDEVQDLIAKLGIQEPGLYAMNAVEIEKFDDVVLRQNAENDAVQELIRPLTDTVAAAAAGPVGTTLPVALDEEVAEKFRIVVVRRA